MPAVSPVRRRSGADSSDAWELHRANTERPSDDIAFANPLRPLPFSFRFLTENVFGRNRGVFVCSRSTRKNHRALD